MRWMLVAALLASLSVPAFARQDSFSQHHRGTCSHHGGVSEWL